MGAVLIGVIDSITLRSAVNHIDFPACAMAWYDVVRACNMLINHSGVSAINQAVFWQVVRTLMLILCLVMESDSNRCLSICMCKHRLIYVYIYIETVEWNITDYALMFQDQKNSPYVKALEQQANQVCESELFWSCHWVLLNSLGLS